MTTPSDPKATVVVPPASQRTITAFGDQVTLHLDGSQTNGRYTLSTTVTPPGGGPPPHWHTNEDEVFLVVSGRAEFFKDGAWTEVPVGTAVFTPRGVVHSFRNAGDTPLVMTLVTSPAGFDVFFARVAVEFAKPGELDMPMIVAIAAEHGIHFA